ncbi:MAG: FG-GAP repeat protein [Myxococcales bacterium]|nr:FG-GAP repeat protein [Myxococcales bacterium]
MLVLAALAPIAAACVGPESVDVQRRDATGDGADVGARPDGAQDVRPMDAADTGVVAMDVPVADVQGDGGTMPMDVVPDIACRTVCGASCTDTQVDPRNCGACFRDCSNLPGVDPGAARCVAGLCVINRACMPNRGDCNGDSTDGCETDLGTTMNCGACATSCSEPTPICTMMPGDGGPAMFRCGSGCVAPTPDRCTSRCVDLQTDPRNCGTCGTICPAATNGVAACVAGRCAVMCNAGFGDCDGVSTNGCETVTRTSITHCGTCGNVCPGVMGATPACANGLCGIACPTGRGDCDMMTANGCETDTRTEVNHCGVCGRVCPPAPNAAAACSAATCSFTCNSGFGNCDGSSLNGCEADFSSNLSHCGRCANPCPTVANSVRTCTATGCGFTCNANFGDCNMLGSDGCEVPLLTNVAHCGRCGNACATPANGTATCAAGACGARCNAGFGDCDSNLANGCETDTNTSMTHCGGCGMVCSAPALATAACVAGRCQITCNPGYRLVGSTCEPEPPRPVFPWAGATTNARRPLFTFVRPATQPSVTVDICTNRACTILETSFVVTGASSGSPAVDLAVGRHYFWRVTGSGGGGPSPARHFIVSAPASVTGRGVFGAMLNPNGDSVVDMLLGSPPGLRADYRTGASPTSTLSPATVMSGSTGFGTSVASAGDVNGDGLVDAIVGAPTSTGGIVHVYFANGSSYPTTASVTITAPASNIQFGRFVSGIGDVNGDGYADIAVGAASGRAFVYYGSATGPATTPSVTIAHPSLNANFGVSISRSCDLNGDGFGDVAFGIDGGSNDVVLYMGGAAGLGATPSQTLTGGAGFGRSVDCAGDVNGDGYSDLVVGEYTTASVSVFHGNATGVVSAASATLTGSGIPQAGFTVSFAGDVDRDGYGDILVGGGASSTSAILYFGSATGSTVTGAVSFSGFSAGVSSFSAGDWYTSDGLGISDIIIGRSTASSTTSRVHLYRGTATRASIGTLFTSISVTTGTGASVAAQ